MFQYPYTIMKRETILKLLAGAVAAIFSYAAVIKLSDYPKSRSEMLNQVFPAPMAEILTWLIPAIEMLLVIFLLLPVTRMKAIWGALLLLSSFSLYIVLGMNQFFSRQPCNCAGILGDNTPWVLQLYFNLFFIGLALTGQAIAGNWINKIKNVSWFHLKNKNQLTSNSA